MSSGVVRGGQRKGEQEAETVYSGCGHGGLILVMLLESTAFIFGKIVNATHVSCQSQKLIATNNFSCRNQFALQVCYIRSIGGSIN